MPNGRTKQLWEEDNYNNDDNFDYDHDSGDQQLSDLDDLLKDMGDGDGIS